MSLQVTLIQKYVDLTKIIRLLIMKLLNNIYSKTLCAFIGLYSIDIYANTCTVYENSQSGFSIKMNNGDYISNLEHYMIERRSWHGYLNGWKGRDRNFNDEASSVVLGDNCKLIIFEHVDRGGNSRSINNHASGFSYRHFDEVGMNEAASSLECNCRGEYPLLKSPVDRFQ
jgi:hypothetical protein